MESMVFAEKGSDRVLSILERIVRIILYLEKAKAKRCIMEKTGKTTIITLFQKNPTAVPIPITISNNCNVF